MSTLLTWWDQFPIWKQWVIAFCLLLFVIGMVEAVMEAIRPRFPLDEPPFTHTNRNRINERPR